MPWTSPPTYVALNVVTATQLNQQFRDNLNYLKGNGEQIQIGTTNQRLGLGTFPGRQLHVYGLGQNTPAVADTGNFGGTVYIQDSGGNIANGGTLLFGAQQGHFAAIKGLLRDGTANTIGDLSISTRANTSTSAFTERIRVGGSNGHVGIGTDGPRGKLQVSMNSSDWMFYATDALDGNAQTLFSASLGGSAIMATVCAYPMTYGGAPQFSTIQGLKSGSYTVWNDGSNQVQIANSGGNVVLQRTGGSATYKVSMWIILI